MNKESDTDDTTERCEVIVHKGPVNLSLMRRRTCAGEPAGMRA